VRIRRRLPGDRADDARLSEPALAEAAARRAIVIVDDGDRLSAPARRALLRDDPALARIVTSRQPVFEVAPGTTRRLAIELPPLGYPEVERLLRDLLQPARLIPEVLLQRLAIRAGGNPGLVVALARDIKHRGGVRRHPGSDDWYVAADEIDTLLAAPSAAWFALRCLEELPPELVPLVRMASALGPQFTAAELEAVVGTDVKARVPLLVRLGVFAATDDRLELADPDVADAIYDHALDERSLVHERALHYWLEHRSVDPVGWLARVAHHAAGAGDLATAATSLGSLAGHARERGDVEQAGELEARAATLH